jgi:uncharacterized protein (TIGR03086 family)
MTNAVDLEPAAQRLAHLVSTVPDELLDAPTPCPDYRLSDLLDHIGGLARGFTATATKASMGTAPSPPPPGDASRLGDDWRIRIPRDLAGMAEAWRDPAAWTGTTRAGGVDLPGAVAGVVALDELVVHGWDVARARGQAYECEPELLEAVHGFVATLPASGPGRPGIFGPGAVVVPDGAPLLDRIIGLTGRDPAWAPPA